MCTDGRAAKAAVLAVLVSATGFAQVPLTAFMNFEGAQTHPIRMSADGTRLYALNTPNSTLSVLSLATPGSPQLIAEIPVGIEPVSVNPRTDDEVWVVNQESNSVSVVSVSKGIVTDTIQARVEPMDVVFAGGDAFVSLSRSNAIAVYSVTTHALVKTIPVFGGNPRALAVSPNGATIYAAFAQAGNGTTLIPPNLAPAQVFPPGATAPQPAPQVGLIISSTDPNWSSQLAYTMPANGVVAINVSSLSLAGYFSHTGTINLGIVVRPATGDVYVANTDALNLTQYQTYLRGHWVNNRITRISGNTVASYDLNPNINYSILPNPSALATALAQPTDIAYDGEDDFMWVAAFGTDRVAAVDPVGNVLSMVELEPSALGSAIDSVHKRGPRGLALNTAANYLYVLNRLTNSISIVNTASKAVSSEIPIGSFNPTPTVIQVGRGFLYDAKLSGSGTGACASCHIDADMDHLAWDLGDPFGSYTSLTEGQLTVQFHPMKGPMTTQTLRGLNGLSPYHWRGDHQNFAAFNPAFNDLMGGNQLSTAQMNAYTAYINTIAFLPNPNQNLDRSLPTSLNGGNPVNGQNDYLTVAATVAPQFTNPNVTCNACHTANPGPGSNRFVNPTLSGSLETDQPLKIPQLRNVYQKQLFAISGPTIDGFGMDHDGFGHNVNNFFDASAFAAYTATQAADIAAYMLCFDTGTAPAVGYTRTATPANVATASIQGDWATLQGQASAGNIDLVAHGTLHGQLHGLLYQPASNNYETDTTGLGPFTQGQLNALILSGDTLSIMGVPPGSGQRIGIDSNLDGVKNGDALKALRAASRH